MVFLLFCLSSTLAAPSRPPVDRQAMEEAIRAAQSPDEGYFSSAASYAHFLKSQLASSQGDSRRAVEELRLALASSPDHPYLRTRLAEEYARTGKAALAEKELRKVIEGKPGYFPAQLLLGRVLLDQRKYNRAKIHLEKAIELSPKMIEPYLALAQLWLERKDFNLAVLAIEKLGQALPGESSGYRKLGLALAERAEWSQAKVMLTRAFERDPHDLQILLALGNIEELTDHLSAADAMYEKALKLDPDSTLAIQAAARVALRQRQLPRARKLYEQLFSLTRDAEMAVKWVFAYWASNQMEEALIVLDSARQAPISEPRLHFYAGLIYEQQSDFQKAYEAFSQILPENPDIYNEALVHRARCLSMMGQPTQAISLLEKAVEKTPLDERALFALALMYEGQNQKEAAIDTMRRVLRINPDQVLAMNFIAYSLAQKGQSLAEAESLVLRALEKKPDDAAFLDSLGWVYFRAGKWDEAVVPLEKAAALSPEDATIQEHLGDVYLELKKYALARKAYERALQRLQEKPELAETPDQRRNIESKIKLLVSQPDAR